MTITWNGNSGNNTYDNPTSEDIVADGKGGNDFIWTGSGNDVVYGNTGNDTVKGWYGDDQLWGDHVVGSTGGEDVLAGEAGNDELFGGRGDDSLSGGSGDDFLSGTVGSSSSDIDTLTGGFGADTFSLGFNGSFSTSIDYLGSGYAVITDFKYWEGDKIRIGGAIDDYTYESVNLAGTSALDTGIYRFGDLIGVVQDVTGSGFIPELDLMVEGGHFS